MFAHIRAAIGFPVQQTNCHPFRHGRWRWMHHGFIDGFQAMKRDLALQVEPERFADIEGTTDSVMLLFPTMTSHRHGISFPFQGTIALTAAPC